MKFDMPPDPATQIQMHKAMIRKIQEASRDVAAKKAVLLPEIARRLDAGEDVRKLSQARKDLRYQELCLADQEKRLKERIILLQERTGNSTTTSEVAG